MEFTRYDAWILIIGLLAAVSCAIPGTFLVLRRQSLLADAVSHSVLPGLVIAFLVSGSTRSEVLLIGAVAVAFASSLAIEWLQSRLEIEGGAALGLVFTSMFALGLLLLRQTADRVHLDADCVLFGGLEEAPVELLDTPLGPVPRAVCVLVVAAAVQIVLVVLFFKELQATTFDPAQAELQGMDPRRLHRLLLAMTAISCIASFEAVGSILVLSLIVVPPATAVLLHHRLSHCLWSACGLGMLSVLLGTLASRIFPVALATTTRVAWMQDVADVSIAGSVAVCAGAVFLAVVIGRTLATRRR